MLQMAAGWVYELLLPGDAPPPQDAEGDPSRDATVQLCQRIAEDCTQRLHVSPCCSFWV
jgi:hypothetical protein